MGECVCVCLGKDTHKRKKKKHMRRKGGERDLWTKRSRGGKEGEKKGGMEREGGGDNEKWGRVTRKGVDQQDTCFTCLNPPS